MSKLALTEDQVMSVLNKCYEAALNGLPNTPNCYEIAEQYLNKYGDAEKATAAFAKWQIMKCSTSGFITSLGGILTLPVAIPANLASVWYIQLRMIATIAVLAGYDPSDDEVQTMAYICLTGASVSKICREAGVQFTNKFTISMIKKIPGEVLTKINQKVGQRFITKFGTKGIINLGKMVPFVGGLVGAGFDFVGTSAIAAKSKDVFFKGILD